MAELATIAMIGGTVLSFAGAMRQAKGLEQLGEEEAAVSRMEAQELRRQAGQEVAASQREAMEERRQARILESRAIARAGFGASDPTVLDIIGDISGEGELRALNALFEGSERARALNVEADVRLFEGQSRRRARRRQASGARTEGIATLITGGVGLADRFNFGGGGATFGTVPFGSERLPGRV